VKQGVSWPSAVTWTRSRTSGSRRGAKHVRDSRDKRAAAAKGKATRVARHTMGPKQKAAIKWHGRIDRAGDCGPPAPAPIPTPPEAPAPRRHTRRRHAGSPAAPSAAPAPKPVTPAPAETVRGGATGNAPSAPTPTVPATRWCRHADARRVTQRQQK